jgi:hypothetical protein
MTDQEPARHGWNEGSDTPDGHCFGSITGLGGVEMKLIILREELVVRVLSAKAAARSHDDHVGSNPT